MRNRLASLVAAVALGIGVVGGASAQELKIGVANLTSSLDPHFATSSYNFGTNVHIYDPLVRLDDEANIAPALATSWKRLDDTTWEFKLRPNVKWHDGSPFTAEDVAYTFARAGNVPGTPNAYRTYLRPIAGTEVIDPLTIRIKTNGAAPALMDNLAYIFIISKKNSEEKGPEDFNSKGAAIGTGPYKVVKWTVNDALQLTRNENYWAGAEPWSELTIRMMPNAAARMAALLSGSIDVAESVPPQDIPSMESNSRVKVWKRLTHLIAYLGMDGGNEALSTGKITDLAGKPLETNPLGDKRVREAMKIAFSLDAFVDRIYRGNASANGQFLLSGRPGNAPGLGAWKQDEARARKLLQDAGWFEKFRVSISISSSAPFPLATPVAEGLAQAWTRIGIQTAVESMPQALFLQSAFGRKLPIYITAFNNVWGTPENFYSTLLHSKTADGRYGFLNFPYYKNDEVDALIEKGFVMLDDQQRRETFEKVTRLTVEDANVLPLWHLTVAMATRADLKYASRADGFLYAMNVRPGK